MGTQPKGMFDPTTFITNQSHQIYTTVGTTTNRPIRPTRILLVPSTASPSNAFAQTFLVLWVFVAFLAFLFNCIQVSAILLKVKRSRRKKLKGSTILILNLSITDALVGLIMLVVVIMATSDSSSTATESPSPSTRESLSPLSEESPTTGESSFEIITTLLLHASWVASLLTLISVTVDRLLLTVKPIQYQLSGTRTFSLFSCLFTWLLTISVAAVMGGWAQETKNNNRFVDKLLTMLLPCLTLPTCVFMAGCYFVVWKYMGSLNRRLKRFEVKVQRHDIGNNDDGGKMECSIAPSLPSHENATTTAEKDERKFTKLAVTIVGLFTLCWLPISILYIMSNTKAVEVDSQTSLYAGSLFQLLAAFNSVLNPLVYLGTFRKTLAKTCFIRGRYDVSSSSNDDATASGDTSQTPLRKQFPSVVVNDYERKKVFEIFY